MRQVFSSARIENVEAVAQLLTDAGVEVRVQNGRSYRGRIRGDFSYRDAPGAERPSVWVVRTDAHPQARALLREHGLLQSGDRGASFLGETVHTRPPASAASGPSRGRFVLFAAIAVLALVAYVATRGGGAPADVAPGTFADPAAPGGLVPIPQAVVPEVYTLAVPPALARTLFAGAAAGAGAPACLAIDGGDPPQELIASLRAAGVAAEPASACSDPASRLDVARYRTDGSGEGTVDLRRGGEPARTVAVRRDGRDWEITGEAVPAAD